MMKRRDFLKLSAMGMATLMVSRIPRLGVTDAFAVVNRIDVTITDAVKEMVTHNAINNATCYFWIYKMTAFGPDLPAEGVDIPADCPGPTIVGVRGDTVTINVTNRLDEPHSLFIPGRLPNDPPLFDSGAIAPNQTASGTLTMSQSGAFLYYDNLNEPVNRVMGLHGALVVRPDNASGRFTPYDNPTPRVQDLFDDFGSSSHFPGLSWEEGDPDTLTPPFRTYVWLCHQASPRLFAEVGNLPAGQIYNATTFMNKFLRDPFSPTRNNNNPEFFTINGQSGFFGHFSPAITPMGRVGEPVVVHILNAGLWTHSMHLHANHFYVTSVNGVPSANPLWLDVYNVFPMDRVDYTVPFMRPPDIPNEGGMGLPDTPLRSVRGNPVWPPVEEFELHFPDIGEERAEDINGNRIDLAQRMSPLCYPMHDHTEPSQTAQGGNYNMGLISGMYVTGDRNTNGFMNFPMDEDFAMMYRNIRGLAVDPAADVGEEELRTVIPAAGPRPE